MSATFTLFLCPLTIDHPLGLRFCLTSNNLIACFNGTAFSRQTIQLLKDVRELVFYQSVLANLYISDDTAGVLEATVCTPGCQILVLLTEGMLVWPSSTTGRPKPSDQVQIPVG